MSISYKTSKPERYRAIYVEDKARDYAVTRAILSAYSLDRVIYIRHYKDILNRPRQSRAQQENYPALVLAVKEAPYVYSGPEVCQSFGHTSFYYSNLLLNCPFNCTYCYLGGMYPSAYCVAFVNTDDFADAIRKTAQENDDTLIALSYDTDLLAFENTYPYTRHMLSALSDLSGLKLEIRTKSAVTSVYTDIKPSPNRVFAFSLSPDRVAKRYEKNAPRLAARLAAVNAAINAGHSVRLCFDPIFTDAEFDEDYRSFFETLPEKIPLENVRDISYGFFRMNRDFYKKISVAQPNIALFSEDYIIKDNVISKSKEECDLITRKHMDIIETYFPKERIYIL